MTKYSLVWDPLLISFNLSWSSSVHFMVNLIWDVLFVKPQSLVKLFVRIWAIYCYSRIATSKEFYIVWFFLAILVAWEINSVEVCLVEFWKFFIYGIIDYFCNVRIFIANIFEFLKNLFFRCLGWKVSIFKSVNQLKHINLDCIQAIRVTRVDFWDIMSKETSLMSGST